MEIPILFSTPMVQAILANRKTMTRRTRNLEEINNNPGQWEFVETVGRSALFQNKKTGELRYIRCPYGQPGDILWVRETWSLLNGFNRKEWKKMFPESEMIDTSDNIFCYKADYSQTALDYQKQKGERWNPSIFMPREAARLFLTVKNVRVERLQDISQEDIEHEGLWHYSQEYREQICIWRDCASAIENTRRKYFRQLWNSINEKRGYGWDKNPYVWVVEFERQ